MLGWIGGKREVRNRRAFSISAQQPAEVKGPEEVKVQEEREQEQKKTKPQGTTPRPVEPQLNVKSKNMSREYGGQWLSSVTRHVRIHAAYIDPETWEFDQTQMDKLTLLLDPSNEFVWTPETCNKVFSYFQELVDHYEVIISHTLLISSHRFLSYYHAQSIFDDHCLARITFARALSFGSAFSNNCSLTILRIKLQV